MKTRPILFNRSMVRAIREGRKTQTRRVINPQPSFSKASESEILSLHPGASLSQIVGAAFQAGDGGAKCPFGVPGDGLWVKETYALQTARAPESDGGWAACYSGPLSERPSDSEPIYRADYDDIDVDRAMVNGGRWRPSIHMPKWASRISLEIVHVRVERLREISEDDARNEGVEERHGLFHDAAARIIPSKGEKVLRAEFARLWESVYGPGSWERNEWLWVIEFKPAPQVIS